MARMVLVVDDEPLVRELIAGMLEEFGCNVETAATADEALERLTRNQQIDLLLTDINMPGMSGYELAERVQRMRDNVHVVLLSGQENDSHGFPFIRKPFVPGDLKRLLETTTGLC